MEIYFIEGKNLTFFYKKNFTFCTSIEIAILQKNLIFLSLYTFDRLGFEFFAILIKNYVKKIQRKIKKYQAKNRLILK